MVTQPGGGSTRDLDVTRPSGSGDDRMPGGTHDSLGQPAPEGAAVDGAQTAGRRDLKSDALAEFARSDEGQNKGVAPSESPRVTVGRADVRFENDPGA